MLRPLLLVLATWMALAAPRLRAQDSEFTVMAFNVENLFDADRKSPYDDFPVDGAGLDVWSPEELARKLGAVIEVLRSIDNGKGPDVVVLNEIEVDQTPESTIGVAEFLTQYQGKDYRKLLRSDMPEALRGVPVEAWLAKALEDGGLGGYRMILGEVGAGSNEAIRNVVLTRLPVRATRQHKIEGARAIIEVRLDLGGRVLTVFANHWKSGAGNAAAERTRMQNAYVLRTRINEILADDPQSELIVAGDLNSHHDHSRRYPYLIETGINDVLGAQGDPWKLRAKGGADLYNLWYDLEPARRRSDCFRGEWGTLMHLAISKGLADGQGAEYVAGSFRTVEIAGLNAHPVTGLPWELTRVGPGAGVSDHFPIVARFRLHAAGATDAGNPLRRPLQEANAPLPCFPSLDKASLRSAEIVNALDTASLAKAIGEPFRLRGEWGGSRMTVRIGDQVFPVYAGDTNLAAGLKSLPAGTKVDWIGLLAVHKGRLQFTIETTDWVR